MRLSANEIQYQEKRQEKGGEGPALLVREAINFLEVMAYSGLFGQCSLGKIDTDE